MYQVVFASRTKNYVGCKRCESICPTSFLSVWVYLWHETTRIIGLAYGWQWGTMHNIKVVDHSFV